VKKLIFSIVSLLLINICFGQNIANKNLELFKNNFNDNKFVEIYANLTEPFKKQITETQLVEFLQNNKAAYGNIVEIDEKDSAKKLFHITTDKNKFDFVFVTNKANEIAGLQIIPVKEKIEASSLEDLINKLGASYMTNTNNAGLVIGVCVNGKTNYFTFGETKKGNTLKPDSSSIFEIGSITKTFTGSLLADAVLNNKIKLTDAISKYVPKNIVTTKNGKAATIVQLANHTAGFYRVTEDLFNAPKTEETNPYKFIDRKYFYSVLSKTDLEFEPGKKSSYSNMGVALLGCLLEDVNKKTYNQLLTEKICATLKMNSTFLKVPKNYLAKRVQGYTSEGKETSYWDFDCIAPTGGIKSNAVDMIQYLNAQYLSKNMLSNAAILTQKETYKINAKQSIGLNWFIQKVHAKDVYNHNGGTGGFASYAAFEKTKKLSVIVLINNQNLGKPDEIGMSIMEFLLQ
jgi:CubicO group peptidase (beta-lactamase class C family)